MNYLPMPGNYAYKKKLTELEQLQNALKITVVYKMKPVPSHVRAALGKRGRKGKMSSN